MLEDWQAAGVQFELYRLGLLFAGRQPANVLNFLRNLEPMREAGYAIPTDALDGDAVRRLEPGVSDAVAAGVVIGEHWHVRLDTLMRGLAAVLARDGVKIQDGMHSIDIGNATCIHFSVS
jgi:D-amino-acid dehydrogenase